MKKRIISFTLAAALTLTPSMGAFAMDVPCQAEAEETITQEADGILTNEAAESNPYAVSLMGNQESYDIMDPDSYVVPFMIWTTYYQQEAHKLLSYVNAARAEVGSDPLVWDSRLEVCAAVRAAETMFLFSHTRPNSRPWNSLDVALLHGENIAAGYQTAEAVFQGWMDSEGHRNNILNNRFKSMGVGLSVVPGTEYTYYWAQNFSDNPGDGKYATDQEKEDVKVRIDILSDEPSRQIRNFVLRLYNVVLGREADPVGLGDWTTLLAMGKGQTGADTAHGFFFSDEFKNKNTSNEEYLRVLYRTILNREADEGGLASWKKLLDGGLSRTYIFHGFCESPEFTELCKSYGIERGNVALTEPRDQNSGITLFVSRLYEYVLGRSADVDGLNAWTNLILTGESTPENVAYGIVFSAEFVNKNIANDAYVNTLYRVFMDRNADPAGLAAWTGQLDQGVSREEVFYGFSKSPEFGDILRSFGL